MTATPTLNSFFKQSKPLTSNRVKVGNTVLQYDKNLLEMTDSTQLYQKEQYKALYDRLQQDGYLLLRNIIPLDTALTARKKMLQHLHSKGVIKKGSELMNGEMEMGKDGKGVAGWTVDAESGG